jgi:hypothetical protein
MRRRKPPVPKRERRTPVKSTDVVCEAAVTT